MKNIVFIAKSLDGFIADKNGGIEWLETIPNPNNEDLGFVTLMNEVDAIVMGKTTFEVVLGFNIEWPYNKHVFVLSNSIKEVPKHLSERVTLLKGELSTILDSIHKKGYLNLYIDGGKTVQKFLEEDLIDELRITTIPILLGGGIPLFGNLSSPQEFNHVSSKVYLKQLVQDCYKRKVKIT